MSYPDRPPTARQAEALRFIAASTLENGYPPSLREVCDALGLLSTNGASDHLRALTRKGMLRVVPGVARGLVLTDEGREYLAGLADSEAPDLAAPEASTSAEESS